MRLTTVTIPAVEMTLEEENRLWEDFAYNREKHGIRFWHTSDGNNEILFEGETTYRVVVRKGN